MVEVFAALVGAFVAVLFGYLTTLSANRQERKLSCIEGTLTSMQNFWIAVEELKTSLLFDEGRNLQPVMDRIKKTNMAVDNAFEILDLYYRDNDLEAARLESQLYRKELTELTLVYGKSDNKVRGM